MDNKTNLSPELKAIYDRVMNSATKIANVPHTQTTNIITSPPPAADLQPSENKNFTPDLSHTVRVVPVSSPPAQEINDIDQIDPNPHESFNISSMAGTVTSNEPQKSKKPLFIGLSLLFVVIWTGFWAVFFGFIKI